MAFVYTVNKTNVNGTQAFYEAMTVLSSSGWTCRSSGDGSSWFSTSGSILTGSGTGVGNLGNTNAWFTMRTPTGTRELLFQRGTTAASWKILYSYAGAFTGTVNGAISATVHPTAVDAGVVLGALANGSTTAVCQTDNNYSLHIICDNAAPYGWYMFQQPPTNAQGTLVAMDPLLTGSYPVEEQDPYVFVASSLTIGASSLQTLTVNLRTWYLKNTASETFVQVPFGMMGQGTTPNVNLGYNPYTGNLDLVPIIYGRSNSHAPPLGWKGISYFFRMPSVTLSRLPYSTTPGARDWIMVGDLAMRWVGEAFV